MLVDLIGLYGFCLWIDVADSQASLLQPNTEGEKLLSARSDRVIGIFVLSHGSVGDLANDAIFFILAALTKQQVDHQICLLLLASMREICQNQELSFYLLLQLC